MTQGAIAQGSGRFEDADGWAQTFDSASRDVWQKPEEVIRALRLAPDMTVADIGAGTGYFSARLARAVPVGRVFAIDMEPGMVAHLRQRVVRERLENVRVIQATSAGPGLPEAVDLVLLVNVQGLVVNPGDYFARLKRDLKPGGRVAIIAARVEADRGAPPEMRAPPERVMDDMRRQGYVLDATHDFLQHQYFLVFRQQP
ncbi:MAG: class I SAM-dependent methyltransferase [Burkholderiales bacterium]|nr:class I SAM-dependent methyltransferase [Burkholderiales bacterium]MDP2397036.1 class I SAM-dependent methyltransferase [Burkholderiales bacterium]